MDAPPPMPTSSSSRSAVEDPTPALSILYFVILPLVGGSILLALALWASMSCQKRRGKEPQSRGGRLVKQNGAGGIALGQVGGIGEGEAAFDQKLADLELGGAVVERVDSRDTTTSTVLPPYDPAVGGAARS